MAHRLFCRSGALPVYRVTCLGLAPPRLTAGPVLGSSFNVHEWEKGFKPHNWALRLSRVPSDILNPQLPIPAALVKKRGLLQ